MLRARERRRYSGATVNAVTWPCHSVAEPSAFPRTVELDESSVTSYRQKERRHTVTHHSPIRRFLYTAQIGPPGEVTQVEANPVLF
jgi:hypothetical protein